MKTRQIKGALDILLVEGMEPDSMGNFFISPMNELLFDGMKFLCRQSEMTEEQATTLVNGWNAPTGGDDYQETYQNYRINSDDDLKNMYHFDYAKESFQSLLEANGVMKENEDVPTREEFGYYSDYDAEGHLNSSGWDDEQGEEKFFQALENWQEAEANVFPPETTLVFIKQ